MPTVNPKGGIIMEITKLNKDEIISVGREALAKSETTSLACLIILHSRFLRRRCQGYPKR